MKKEKNSTIKERTEKINHSKVEEGGKEESVRSRRRRVERQGRMRKFALHKTGAPERNKKGDIWDDDQESSKTNEKHKSSEALKFVNIKYKCIPRYII